MATYTSSSFSLDTVGPTPVAAPTLRARTTDEIQVNFNLNATESHEVAVDKYKLFYKQAISGVTEGDTEIDDVAFDSNPTSGWVTTGAILQAATYYTFAIWGYDTYGNKTKSSETTLKSLVPDPASISTVHVQDDGVHVNGVDDGYVHSSDPILAGETTLWVDYASITADEPYKTQFVLVVASSTGSHAIRLMSPDEFTVTPDPEEFDVTSFGLNADWLVMARVEHWDVYGVYAVSDSTAYYVKPYTPPAPIVTNNGTEDTLDIVLSVDASESNLARYAIQETSSGKYLKTNFELGDDPAWQSRYAWHLAAGSKVIAKGLASWTTYTFRVMAKNAHGDEESDWSTTDDAQTSDTTNPTVSYVHVQDSSIHSVIPDGYNNSSPLMPAGLTSLWVDYSEIVELHPDRTKFSLRRDLAGVNGTQYDQWVEDDTIDPTIPEFDSVTYPEIVTNGASRFWFRLSPVDKATNSGEGGTGLSGYESHIYTQPYTPQAPTVIQGTHADELDVTPVAHASEHVDVEYMIYEDLVENAALDGDGYFVTDVDEIEWRTIANWGTVTVGSLAESTLYRFKVRSRNFYSGVETEAEDVVSDWSPQTSETTLGAITVTISGTPAFFAGCGVLYYEVIANQENLSNPIMTAEYTIDSGITWVAMINIFGDMNKEVVYGWHSFFWRADEEAPGNEIADCQIKVTATIEEV